MLGILPRRSRWRKIAAEEPDEGGVRGGHLPGLTLSRREQYAWPGCPVLKGHGANGAGKGECVEAVQLAACWRGGELPPVPDGGPAVEVARVCDKSRHVPASL